MKNDVNIFEQNVFQCCSKWKNQPPWICSVLQCRNIFLPKFFNYSSSLHLVIIFHMATLLLLLLTKLLKSTIHSNYFLCLYISGNCSLFLGERIFYLEYFHWSLNCTILLNASVNFAIGRYYCLHQAWVWTHSYCAL